MPASPEPPAIGPVAAGAVRKATADDVPALALAMARAFHDDPGFSHVLAGLDDRLERLRRFFATEIRNLFLPLDCAWTTEEVAGGALWAPPGRWRVPISNTIREGPPMLGVFGRRLPRALHSRIRMERLHPGKPEHWYLAAIGVDPEWQGRGVGGALMAPVLEQADAESKGAYLEASSRRSRAMYERHGFELSGEFNLPAKGPPIWRMWREPAGVT